MDEGHIMVVTRSTPSPKTPYFTHVIIYVESALVNLGSDLLDDVRKLEYELGLQIQFIISELLLEFTITYDD
jgi:hypothetical protein